MGSDTYAISTRTLQRERRLSWGRPAIHEVHAGGEDGDVVLTCGRISATARNGELALSGPLADGLTLYRRRITRFELRDADGTVRASFRQRAPRPGRSWHPSWEVTVADAPPVVITEDATFSTRKAMQAELRGDPLVHHRTDGLASEGYTDHALVTHDPETCPLDASTALIAALIAWRIHRPADPS